MKKIFRLSILFLAVYILISCNKKKNDFQNEWNKSGDSLLVNDTAYSNIKTNERKDTIHNYWQPTYDTITYKNNYRFLNKNFTLELKTFSLNDSAIVRKLDEKYIDYSHTIVTDIKIINENIVVDQKRIDKTIFKEYLIPEFYEECNLFNTEYDSVLNNQLHLTSILSIPDIGNQWQIKYSLSISKNIDSLSIKDVSYVGN
ncbi:MAG: hypothetical protein H0X63_11200 [Flavobacteriales bacterium]|nr:hypothetical protein [Flavobacteriales bacterium]